jgi:hypothetical protein
LLDPLDKLSAYADIVNYKHMQIMREPDVEENVQALSPG